MIRISTLWMAAMVAIATTGCGAGQDGSEQDENIMVSQSALGTAVCTAIFDEKNFNLPDKSDLRIRVLACLQQTDDHSQVRARLNIFWNDLSPFGTFGDGAHKFNDLVFHARLEKAVASGDHVVFSEVCDKKEIVNSKWNGQSECVGNWHARNGQSWQADGDLLYDITHDGLGNRTWQLTGTPHT